MFTPIIQISNFSMPCGKNRQTKPMSIHGQEEVHGCTGEHDMDSMDEKWDVYPILANIIRQMGWEPKLREALANIPFGGKIVDQMVAPFGPMSMGVGGTVGKVPYSKAPDSLMGFTTKKPWAQKSFDELNYKYELPVRVKFKDGDILYDTVKGLNRDHALEHARRNWEGAEIKPVTQNAVDEYYRRLIENER
jgi:hypothetical protein